MDIYKENFTSLEKEIMRVLFVNSGKKLNQRKISKILSVSPTAVANSVKKLNKKNFICIKKEEDSREVLVQPNLENIETINMKRVENLRSIYSSGLFNEIYRIFPFQVIILFGSFSRGEDSYLSDIDLAVIGTPEKEMSLEKYEKMFEKKINIQFFDSFSKIHKDLKESLANGIILQGGFEL